MEEAIAKCDFCKQPLDDDLSVQVWRWLLHPECSSIVRGRLLRFAAIIFDTTDEEFELWLKDSDKIEGRT